MNTKIQTINTAVNEIREILNAECTPIEKIPDLVRSLAEDPAKSGFTTAFIFSRETNPSQPTGGNLDVTTGLVTDIEEEWSQNTAVSRTRSINNTLWMSQAVFNPSGEKVTEWSVPVNLKGQKGDTGDVGPQGLQGPPGITGEKGTDAKNFRTVSVYKTTDTTDTPSKPDGGLWKFSTNEVIPPLGWSSDINKNKKYLWVSQGTFDEKGTLLADWSIPFRMNGEDGRDGVDGESIEFIYRLLPDYESYNELSNYLVNNPLHSPLDEDKYLPSVNDQLGIDSEWTDSPSGITEVMNIEVCCSRRKSENGWSDWTNCIIWARWGHDGLDGESVEYIYLTTPNNITSEEVKTQYMPDLTSALDDARYLENEFCFNEEWGYPGYYWSDEPLNVNAENPIEWVSIRKTLKGKWGVFSDPKIWATYTEKGKDGNNAPIIYPMGTWENITYIGNSNKAPYVEFDGKYYVACGELNEAPNAENIITEGANWNEPLNKWVLLEGLEYVITKAILADYAKLNDFVFYSTDKGSYMFSTIGKLGGEESSEYDKFSDEWFESGTPSSDVFVPNILINSTTGESWFAGRSVVFGKNNDNVELKLEKISKRGVLGITTITEKTTINPSGFNYEKTKDSAAALGNYPNTKIEIGENGFSLRKEGSNKNLAVKLDDDGFNIQKTLPPKSGGEPVVSNVLSVTEESIKLGEITINDNGELISTDTSDTNSILTFGNGRLELVNPNGSNVGITPEQVYINHDGINIGMGDCGNIGMILTTKNVTNTYMFCPEDDTPQIGLEIASSEEGMSIANGAGQFGGLCPKTVITSISKKVDFFDNVVIATGDTSVITIEGDLHGKWVRVINATQRTITVQFNSSNDVFVNLTEYEDTGTTLSVPSKAKVDLHCTINPYSANYRDWYVI